MTEIGEDLQALLHEVGEPNLDRVLQFAGAPKNEYTRSLAGHCLLVLSALSWEGMVSGNPWTANKFDGLSSLMPEVSNEGDDSTPMPWAAQYRGRFIERLGESWREVLEKWEEWE